MSLVVHFKQTRHNIQVTGQDQILIIMQQMIVEKETNQQEDDCKQ